MLRDLNNLTEGQCCLAVLDTPTKTLHLDGDVELRDLLRLSLEAIKTNLIIGVTICLLLFAAVTCFFVSIDESKMLPDILPIFVGIPCIVVIGRTLQVYVECRKVMADLKKSGRTVHYLFHEDGDGYDVMTGKNFSHAAWEGLTRASESPHFFRWDFGKTSVWAVPKRFFKSEAEVRMMRKLLHSKLGEKAKLQGD